MTADKTREEIMERLEKYFEAYYNINKASEDADPLKLRCDLHVNNQKYFLFKKNVVWEANCHEYVYIFSLSRLTEDVYRQCERIAYEAGMKLVDPVPNHMYTYITCVIVADETEPEAVKALKKCHIYKSFRFSLRGWMEFRTALLDRSAGRAFTNRAGREYAKFFNIILNNKSKKHKKN